MRLLSRHVRSKTCNIRRVEAHRKNPVPRQARPNHRLHGTLRYDVWRCTGVVPPRDSVPCTRCCSRGRRPPLPTGPPWTIIIAIILIGGVAIPCVAARATVLLAPSFTPVSVMIVYRPYAVSRRRRRRRRRVPAAHDRRNIPGCTVRLGLSGCTDKAPGPSSPNALYDD